MSSNPLRLQILLRKYIRNTATQAEMEEFWGLISQLSENDLIRHDIKSYWESSDNHEKKTEINWDKLYQVLTQKIRDQEISYTRRIEDVKRRRIFYTGIAVSLIIAMFVVFFQFTEKRRNNKDISLISAAVEKVKPQHQTISLPDGTKVILNKDSKLDYPPAFHQASRDVYLSGEAYFDVKRDPGKPFLVHTGKIVTRVLGTSFNIKAYPGETALAVTVTRGKVQVQSDNTKKTLGILIAGDQLIIDKKTNEISLNKANVDQVTEWKTNDLLFDDATVDEVVIALGNHYSVSFVFEHDALRNCRLTANFLDDSLSQSLDVICALINASWEQIDSTTIKLKGKGCE